MKQHLTAGLVSLGIAFAGITSAPAPPRADNESVAIIVGSAIALFALKEILEGNAKADDRKRDRNRDRHYKKRKPAYNYWQRNRFVPRQCYYRYSDRNRTRGVFGEGCMRSVMGRIGHLPSGCRLAHGRQFGRAPAYDARCLKDRGYRVEARRR